MNPAGLIGTTLAALGALVLLAVPAGFAWHKELFGMGWNSKTISVAGLVGIVGFGLLASGLRIISNSRNN